LVVFQLYLLFSLVVFPLYLLYPMVVFLLTSILNNTLSTNSSPIGYLLTTSSSYRLSTSHYLIFSFLLTSARDLPTPRPEEVPAAVKWLKTADRK
jgi:hypothetical protein